MKNAPTVIDQSAKVFVNDQSNYITKSFVVRQPKQALPLPTDKEIEQAIADLRKAGKFHPSYFYHESHDSTRIAFAWFDAQKTIKTGNRWMMPLKHIIESWGCRYCSTDSVVIAAHLHPRIKGNYPAFNLSARLTLPAPERLFEIDEAGIHLGYANKYLDEYAIREVCHD